MIGAPDYTCKTCMFWKPTHTRSGGVSDTQPGECHRHAPTSVYVETRATIMAVWPPTHAHGWCGDGFVKPIEQS